MTAPAPPAHTGGDPDLCPGCRALPVALVPAVLCPGPGVAPGHDPAHSAHCNGCTAPGCWPDIRATAPPAAR